MDCRVKPGNDESSCPGRDAARSTCEALLRRTGTVPNAGARYGPGSAAHRSVRTTRRAASGAQAPDDADEKIFHIPCPRSPDAGLLSLPSCPVRERFLETILQRT